MLYKENKNKNKVIRLQKKNLLFGENSIIGK